MLGEEIHKIKRDWRLPERNVILLRSVTQLAMTSSASYLDAYVKLVYCLRRALPQNPTSYSEYFETG